MAISRASNGITAMRQEGGRKQEFWKQAELGVNSVATDLRQYPDSLSLGFHSMRWNANKRTYHRGECEQHPAYMASHTLSRYVLCAYCVPETVPGTRIAVN